MRYWFRLGTAVIVIWMFMAGLLCPGPASAAEGVRIIISKKLNKLAFICDDKVVKILPVATGRSRELTPEGSFRVVRKLKYPYYTRGKIPGGSPRNPLGVRWLGLDAWGTAGGTYGIHGTNNPRSIGRYASGGCIRMLNTDVSWLYDNTPVGTPVEIINREWDLTPKPVRIIIEGQELITGTGPRPFMEAQRVMGPCRLLAENLGCTVTWDEAGQTVTVTGTDKNGAAVIITAQVNSRTIIINGSPLELDVPVVMLNDVLFMPVRILPEALGYTVTWEENARTVTITAAQPVIQNKE